MSKNVVIIGAGGHGRTVADIVLQSGDRVLGFLDDAENLPDTGCHIRVLGPVSDYAKYPEAWFVIAIGNAAVRRRIAKQLRAVRWYTAVHPAAAVSPMRTVIGEGTVIMANASVNPCAHIGKHCIINTAAVVEHDNQIGDYVHVSVGAKLAGTVTIGEGTWIGIGAVVSNDIAVCSGCMIGAGAVVVKNIEEPGTYAGVPAKKIK